MVDIVQEAPGRKAKVAAVEMLHVLIILMIVRSFQQIDDLLA